jgi:esterase
MKHYKGKRATIPYTVHGTGSRAIVFIHGFVEAGAVWGRVIDHLRCPDVMAVSLDLPGMGDMSESEGPFTLRAFADAVISVIDALDVPVILAGQSMGAQIAELASADRTSRVQGLILVTPVPLRGLPVSEQVAAKMCSPREVETQRKARRQMTPHISLEMLEILVQASLRPKARNLPSLFKAWSEGDPSGCVPCAGAFPVLVIGGEKDPFVPPSLVREAIVPRFRKVDWITMPGLCHWPHAESPQAVAAEINRFLKSISRSYNSEFVVR